MSGARARQGKLEEVRASLAVRLLYRPLCEGLPEMSRGAATSSCRTVTISSVVYLLACRPISRQS
jgi:hypothetical protein